MERFKLENKMLNARILKILEKHDILFIETLAINDRDLLRLPGIGKSSLREIREFVGEIKTQYLKNMLEIIEKKGLPRLERIKFLRQILYIQMLQDSAETAEKELGEMILEIL